ncbi:hypothetical protein [Streptomyces longisporoflavus]|uniref:Uncharacterized protein n=1 Tax=Streptomyces longisporoflavus TaxID=28044 RepID=A0ABW7QV10_9ACTN
MAGTDEVGRTDQTDRTDQVDRTDRTDQADQADQADRTDRPDQTAQGDKDSDAVTPPYTDATLARLAMAQEACELAELARAAVPIGEHELRGDGTVRSPGTVLAGAADVLRAAYRFFEAAAVCERTGGASWQLIGDVLGVEARTARARFAAAESSFVEQLRSPAGPGEGETPGGPGWWRAYTAGSPLEAARDLDDWVLRHEDGDGNGDGDGDGNGDGTGDEDKNGDLGTTPVSGGLARLSGGLARRDQRHHG